jgi:predicted ATPase
MRAHFLALLVEALDADADEALHVLDEALAMTSTGEGCYQPELFRLKGERLLARAADRREVEAADECLARSLAIARQQNALSLELRTAMSLAQRHLDGGRPDLARDLVRPIYERFAEGLDTLDLREARALLDGRSPRRADSRD